MTAPLDVSGPGAATATTTVTREAPVVEATADRVDRAGDGDPDRRDHRAAGAAGPPAAASRHRPPLPHCKPLLVLALAAGAATAAAVLLTVIEVAPPPDGTVPEYAVNDFGTNNTVAGALAAGMMVLGALAWCAGQRWGAGLAGGAGASLAGWAALVLGAAEWRLELAAPGCRRHPPGRLLGPRGGRGPRHPRAHRLVRRRRSRRAQRARPVDRGARRRLVRDRRRRPADPRGDGRLGEQLDRQQPGRPPDDVLRRPRSCSWGCCSPCGVLGCLLVRRWGLGLAVGGALAAGWLLVTAATDRTPSPIGPGYSNPPFVDSEPHGVTIVGFALAGFFALVAVVMALLDAER